MKKIINFRLLFAIAVSIILGIVACNFRPTIRAWGIGALFLIAVILFGVSFFVFKNASLKLRVIVAVSCFIFSLVGYYRFYGCVSGFNQDAVPNGNYTVTGTVSDISFNEKGKKILLKDCRYDDINGENLLFYGGEDTEINIGDRITVKLTVSSSEKEINGKYSYFALENIGESGSGAKIVSVDGNSNGIFDSVRRKIRGVLVGSEDEISSVALALSLGDASRLSYEEKGVFRLGGLAHVFAVSGLHIGLFFLALSFLLKPVKLSVWIKNSMIFIAVLFYSGVCGFSPSSLRASLTVGAFLTARCFGEKPDNLNGLSLASITISLVNPSDVLSVGYILSFTVCFFIFTLSPPISRKTRFLGEKFSAVISVLTSAELASLPILIIYFGKFPVVSFISNLALIPVITVAFYLLWAAIIISLILPILNFTLFLPFVMFKGVYGISTALSVFGTITAFPKGLLLPYYFSLFSSSDVVNISVKSKKYCSLAIAIILFICLIMSFI